MLRRFLTPVFVAGLSAGSGVAAPAVIGQASASGMLNVDHASVWGNATLFEGTSVVTTDASGSLALRSGTRIQLAGRSQAVVGEKRIILEKGSLEKVSGRGSAPGNRYEVEARGLRIAADGGARMLVALDSSNGVNVTAVAGIARVSDRAGLLLAAIPQGRSVAFAMPQQAAGGTAVMRSGCLLYKENHFIMQDDATSEVIELNGSDLGPNTGNRVQVTGNPTTAKPVVSIATSVMNVTNVAPRSSGGCLAVAQTLDAKTDAPAAGAAPASSSPQSAPANASTPQDHHGMSGGAKAAIIILVAGGGAGAAVAVISSKKSSTSP